MNPKTKQNFKKKPQKYEEIRKKIPAITKQQKN